MSLCDGRLSQHGYLGAGCGEGGASEELCSLQGVGQRWFWCLLGCLVFLHVTCIRNSSCLGCTNQWLRGTLQSTPHFGLGTKQVFGVNYSLPLPPKSLKTGYSEQSSNGPREQIVFGSHWELGKCGGISPEWSFQGSTGQLHASNYEPSRSTCTLWTSLILHPAALSASTVAPLLLCWGWVSVPNLSSQKQLSGRLPRDKVRCATIQNKKIF